jgi:isocitrate dehydrogenase
MGYKNTGSAISDSVRAGRRTTVKHQITLIAGDGIGPEVIKPTLKVIKAAGVEIEWETFLTGTEALKKSGKTLPNEPMDSFNRCKVALKGPITTPVAEGFPSVNVALRKNFNHFANLRPVKNLRGIESRYKHIDLVIVRENTEGLYSGIEHEVEPVHGSGARYRRQGNRESHRDDLGCDHDAEAYFRKKSGKSDFGRAWASPGARRVSDARSRGPRDNGSVR